jgi:hypothetical protein
MRYGRRLIGPAFAVILSTAVLALTSHVAAQEKPKETQTLNHWHAKYLYSSEGLKGTPGVELTMTSQTLEFAANHRPVLSIPLGQITQVDSHNERPASAALAGLETAIQTHRDLEEITPVDLGISSLVFGGFGFIPTAGISTIVHTHDKYTVALAWGADTETYHAAKIRLGPAEYASLITHMQQATGKPWINLRAEEEKLRKGPERILSVWLDEPAQVGNTWLAKGNYQIVCLEREGGQANLVFVAGNSVNPHKIRAIAPAEIVGAADESAATPITYGDKNAAERITEVRIAGKQVRIKEGY